MIHIKKKKKKKKKKDWLLAISKSSYFQLHRDNSARPFGLYTALQR